MKNWITVSLACLSLSASVAFASKDTCEWFHIQIANLTKVPCVLTSQKLVHGNLTVPPPAAIHPGDSRQFDMRQAVFGPEILLSYQCGSENVTFKSKQNLCYLEAGNVHGEVLHPLPVNIAVKYMATSGSWFWDMPGNIIWQIYSLSS